MSGQWTPGEWSSDGFSWAPVPHVRSDSRHWSICAVHEGVGCTDPDLDISRTEAEANARLICASPDMVKALEWCVEIIQGHADEHDLTRGHPYGAVLAAATAALQKAGAQ